MSHKTVLWDGMGSIFARNSWMAALLASFLALFVLVSAAEAATCAPEAVASHAAEAISDTPSDPNDGDGPDQHAICGHGHCHHSAVASAPVFAQLTAARPAADRALPRPEDRLASRQPTGPDRPPRG